MGRRQTLALGAALVLAASAGRGEPTATCTARRMGDRIVADVEVRDLIDDETLRLMRLGLAGRLRIEAAAVRRRWLIVRQQIAGETVDRVISSSPQGPLLLDGRPEIPDTLRFSLGRVSLPVARDAPADATLEVKVQLQVITATSLGEAAAWVTGRKRADTASAFERGLLSAVVDDLARRATAVCRVEDSREHPR